MKLEVRSDKRTPLLLLYVAVLMTVHTVTVWTAMISHHSGHHRTSTAVTPGFRAFAAGLRTRHGRSLYPASPEGLKAKCVA